MRTKTLLLAAAISAAGLASSMAQIFSANVVGYYNIATPTNGLYLIANQLDLDGTGANNTLQTTIGTNVPANTHVYAHNNVNYVNANFLGGNWVGSTATVNSKLQPGGGVFFERITGGPTSITLVGNVLQGTLVNTPFVGRSITSSKVPQAGAVDSVLGLSLPNVGTPQGINQFRNWVGGASYNNKPFAGGIWLGGAPSISIGEAFWLNAAAGATWTRNFTVGP